jgi:hypothetical protein
MLLHNFLSLIWYSVPYYKLVYKFYVNVIYEPLKQEILTMKYTNLRSTSFNQVVTQNKHK